MPYRCLSIYGKKLPELQVAPSLSTVDSDCHTVRGSPARRAFLNVDHEAYNHDEIDAALYLRR